MKVKLLLIGLMLLCLNSYAQDNGKNICGSYKDGFGDMVITGLILKKDSTFELSTPDPIFPYTHQNYTNTGRWTYKSQSIILNPSLKPRQVKVEVNESHFDSSDSITVKINYILEEYENEKLVSSEPFEFEMLTLTLNGKRRGYNLRNWASHPSCLLAPKVKNQVLLDSLGTARIAGKDLKSISVYSYGFDQPLVFTIENRETNCLEIEITQPIDKERMPRRKEVIVKGNNAFYYEREGKVITTGMLSPLIKQN